MCGLFIHLLVRSAGGMAIRIKEQLEMEGEARSGRTFRHSSKPRVRKMGEYGERKNGFAPTNQC